MGREQGILLAELRTRFLRVVGVFCVFFGAFFAWYRELFAILFGLLQAMPFAPNIVVLGVFEGVYTAFSLCFYAAALLTLPWCAFELWGFVSPALYPQERRPLLCLLTASLGLFYLGCGVGIGWVLPMLFTYAQWFLPQEFSWMLALSSWVCLMWMTGVVSGLCLQMPVLLGGLAWLGWVTPMLLTAWRPYVVLGLFVLAMVLTPPDVFAQVALALPLWALYELSVLVVWVLARSSTCMQEASREEAMQTS